MSLLTASLLFLLAGVAPTTTPAADIPPTLEVAHADHVDWPLLGAEGESSESHEKDLSPRAGKAVPRGFELAPLATGATLPQRVTDSSARRAVLGCVASRGPPARA